MSYFSQKVVWITGATSGIGEFLAYELNKQGAKLAISGRRTTELERVKSNCSKEDQVFVLPLDVTQTSELPKFTEKVWNHFGQIDILINNAGISQRSQVLDTVLEVDRRIMEVNYFGAIALTKAVLPYMKKQGSGQIVVTSSVMGKIGTPQRSAYAASKHALHGFYDSLRAEVIKNNISVCIICPGYVHTNITLNALTADGSPMKSMSESTENGYPPDVFAKKAARAIAKQKEEVYIGKKEVIAVYIKRFFPKLWSYLVTRLNVT
jgi:short-subunit dehydrogenase